MAVVTASQLMPPEHLSAAPEKIDGNAGNIRLQVPVFGNQTVSIAANNTVQSAPGGSPSSRTNSSTLDFESSAGLQIIPRQKSTHDRNPQPRPSSWNSNGPTVRQQAASFQASRQQRGEAFFVSRSEEQPSGTPSPGFLPFPIDRPGSAVSPTESSLPVNSRPNTADGPGNNYDSGLDASHVVEANVPRPHSSTSAQTGSAATAAPQEAWSVPPRKRETPAAVQPSQSTVNSGSSDSWSVMPDPAILARIREAEQNARGSLPKATNASENIQPFIGNADVDGAADLGNRGVQNEPPRAAQPEPGTLRGNPSPAFDDNETVAPNTASPALTPPGHEGAPLTIPGLPKHVRPPAAGDRPMELQPAPRDVNQALPAQGIDLGPGFRVRPPSATPTPFSEQMPSAPQHSAQPYIVQPSDVPSQPESFLAPRAASPAPTQQHYGASPAVPASGFGAGHSVFGARPGTSGFRATVECDAPVWMSPYNARASVAASEGIISAVRNLPNVPPGYSPWWDDAVRQSTGPGGTSFPVDVPMLLQDAMLYSPQVNAIKAEPEVLYRVITQEAAKFDWTAFLESTYDDLNDPVGNTLTTGNGQDRLLTQKFRGAGGLRGKNLLGGEFRLAQEIGTQQQNSIYFVPNDQGTSRLELSYRQPLLDGAGRTYNESEIILASIQANSSEDEVIGALQDHLIEVTEAYWALYRSRAEFFQRQKLLQSAQDVLVRLEGRSQVDTIPRQVLRARAAVARAQTRIQRTLARVEDAEAQLRLLVNSPGMLNGGPIEVIPLEPPNMVTEPADLQSILQTALINRPDISEAIRKMRASSVRLGVSRQELLPRLDLLVETYVADLAANDDVGRSLQGQFGDNRPGYTVGMEFELPIENRAARAKLEQRQWELKRSVNVFRATVEKSLTDVEIARREVATAFSDIVSRYHSMMAANQESNYLADRFSVLPAAEDSATLLLEDLLDSFERMADEEASFVQAQVDHAVALVRLKKEMGVLLRSRHARPEVESTELRWMNNRLHSGVMNSGVNTVNHTVTEAFRNHPQSSARSVETTGSMVDVNGGNVGVRGSNRPVRAYPTTWSRPAASAGRTTASPPAAGYSNR